MLDFEKINEVLLRRKNKVLFPTYIEDTMPDCSITDVVNIFSNMSEIQLTNEKRHTTEAPGDYLRLVFSALVNLNYLGYTVSEDVIKLLLMFHDIERLQDFLFLLINNVKQISGADKEYNPMYKNFPQDVMSMSEFELYFNQIIHYWCNGEVYPIEHYMENQKLPLQDKTKLITLTLGTFEDYENIFINMMKSPTSISEKDKEDLINFLSGYQDAIEFIPEKIPFKENMAFIASYIFNNVPDSQQALYKMLKTSTDVLRFITSESQGDVTLTTPTRYCKFNRNKRRILLSVLEHSSNLLEDMKRYKNQWIRIGEILHPLEYKNMFPKTAMAFDKLRNDVKIETFNSKVESLLKNKQWLQAVEVLKTRPGEFARRLDFIIRNVDPHDVTSVLNSFKNVSTKIANPLLLNLKEHFIKRIQDIDKRVVFSKGNVSNVHLIDEPLKALNIDICKQIIKICENALIANYTNRDLMGNVYIDPQLRNHIVPFSQRSASDMKNIITRGSRINVNPQTKYIRAFTWWTNQGNSNDFGAFYNRVDIDLSVTLLNNNLQYIDHCSFTHLKNSEYNMYHSGDITNGGPADGNGVAEFIDMSIDTLKEKNVAYVMLSVHNYTGQSFSQLINCDFGFMERTDINSGEIFEPKTVVNRMRISSNSHNTTPVVYDVVNNQFIWIDTSIQILPLGWHIVEHTMQSGSQTLYGIINMDRANMYDVALYNVKARGCLVDDKEDADIIFLADHLSEEEQYLIDDVNHPRKVITCYDIDDWYALL